LPLPVRGGEPVGTDFEWDVLKAERDLRKHGVRYFPNDDAVNAALGSLVGVAKVELRHAN
jgi:uncharacterized DUF497 family protein